MSNSESRRMIKTIQVRATSEEKEILKEQAAAFGISIGELIRQTVFRTKPRSLTDKEAIMALAKTRADLGRLGGLLKGGLSGLFSNSQALDPRQARALLHEIECAQTQVLNAVDKLIGKA